MERYDFDEKVTRTIERTGDYKFIVAFEGQTVLPPILMEAWRGKEDGRVDWLRVPLTIVSPHTYHEAALGDKTSIG